MISIPRIQLFELEDLAWLPQRLRNYLTDYLQLVGGWFDYHLHVIRLLDLPLRHSQAETIVDLGSGGSGSIGAIVEGLHLSGHSVTALLTDLYPNTSAFERVCAASHGRIRYRAEPLDARSVPSDLVGFRTLFNCFHHFAPTDAMRILRSAVEANQPIAIFEIPRRSVSGVMMSMVIPFMVLVATPMIRPIRWGRLLFTYILPVLPLACAWDGLVSVLRSYTVLELQQFAKAAGGDHYTWKSGTERLTPSPLYLTYLIGWPAGSKRATQW